jgi:hypothetical protein
VLFTFVVFVVVSTYFGLTNAASCGCFGGIQVNPWIVVGLDCALAMLLCRWNPDRAGGIAERQSALRLLTMAVILVSVLATPFLAALSYGRLREFASVSNSADPVMLDPETWIGDQFPLLQDLGIGRQLANGSWVVVLYHHDCSDCQAVLPRYQALASDPRYVPQAFRVALIEMPPYDVTHQSIGLSIERGRLSDKKDWFVRAPAEILLRDGQVVDARTGQDVEIELENRAIKILGHGEKAP